MDPSVCWDDDKDAVTLSQAPFPNDKFFPSKKPANRFAGFRLE